VPQRSDWLIGINGTRAMTAFNSKTGGFHLTTVGRVQTPTLAILVEREEKIKKFIPRNYWEIHGTFGAQAGEYVGRWFDEKLPDLEERLAPRKEGDDQLKQERVWDVSFAEAHQNEMSRQAGHRHGRKQADDFDVAACFMI
jgi:DNA topoisomerase-3